MMTPLSITRHIISQSYTGFLPAASDIRMAAKILLNKHNAGRQIDVKSDDRFLVSYPKSGNTWLRFLVANLISIDAVDFSNIESIIPDIYQHSNRSLDANSARSLDLGSTNCSKRRVLKSHEYFDPRYQRLVYIVRDPRDVVVSYYHHHIKFNLIHESYPFDLFFERFMAGNLDPYGSWYENVASWRGTREGTNGFLEIRYEDLLATPLSVMKKVAEVLSLQCSSKELRAAIEKSSLSEMKKAEQNSGSDWRALTHTRRDKPFVRAGTAGGWRSVLSPTQTATMEKLWGPLMSKLQYI